MKKLWYITIFYSHIESYKHLYGIHMKTLEKRKCFLTQILLPRNLAILGILSAPILMQYPAIIHKHVFTDSLCLVSLFPLGSIRTMFFDRISKFLLG